MEPFKVSNHMRDLKSAYPDAEDLLNIAKQGGESARCAIARQWLSEGIPYAFKDCPAIYESLREWLALRLDVDPKDVSITGSARIGQSLAPSKLGKQFDETSDLDIFIVNEKLFDRLKADYLVWSDEYESHRVMPSNNREATFWKDNLYRCPKNIARGFIDTKLIPNYEKYQMVRRVEQTTFLLKGKLAATEYAPNVSHVSVRCYKSWSSYVNQISLGFR
jgi:hypothetical protein